MIGRNTGTYTGWPMLGMVFGAFGLVSLSSWVIWIAAIVVTIVQHRGISQDRRNDTLRRDRRPFTGSVY